MSLVATLICNPADPALDTTAVDGAIAILPSPGHAQWLFDEVAVGIPFTGSDDIRAVEHPPSAGRGDPPLDNVGQPQGFISQKLLLAAPGSTSNRHEYSAEPAAHSAG